MAFIFNANAGETPEMLAKKRRIAEALLGNRRQATDLGSGLSELGNALAYRMMMGQVERGEAAGAAAGQAGFAPIINAFAGGGGPAPSPLAGPAPAPVTPQKSAGMSFNGSLPEVNTSSLDLSGYAKRGRKVPRGIRNNNPGNIEFGKFARSKGALGSDGRFARFQSPEEGIGAMASLLRGYQGKGLTTVRQMVNRWAPPSENDTGAYANAVARGMGINPDTPFKFGGPIAQKMIAAMINHENGFMPFSADQIARGVGGVNVASGPVVGENLAVPDRNLPGTPMPAPAGTKGVFPPDMTTPGVPKPMNLPPTNVGGSGLSPQIIPASAPPAPMGSPDMMSGPAPRMTEYQRMRLRSLEKAGGMGPTPNDLQALGVGQNAPVAPSPAAPAPMMPDAGAPAPASPQGQQMPPGQLDLPTLLKAANDPWVMSNPVQAEVIKSLIEMQIGANDPVKKAQLEKLYLDIEQTKNPPVKPTDDMREYQVYVDQTKAAGQAPMPFFDWQQAGRKAGATNVTVGGEPPDGEFRKALDKKEGDLWSEYQSKAAVAGSAANDFAALKELIKVAPQGPLEGRLAQAFPGFSSAGAAFQSIVSRIAPTLRVAGSGATSDIEYEGMLKSLPQLLNEPDANMAIASMMEAKAKLDVERGDLITRYQAGDVSLREARRQMAELNKRSIMPPELQSLIKAYSDPSGKEDALSTPPVSGRPVLDGGGPTKKRIRYNPQTGDFE